MKNIGGGIAVAATYAFAGFLVHEWNNSDVGHDGAGVRALIFFVLIIVAAVSTWRLVSRNDS